jgi:phage baseplate assembly protein W
MAFGPKKIFPIDTQPGTAVGVSIPFNAPAVFFSTYTTKDAVRNNLLNYFLTNTSEIYLNPTFGANLRAFIFEQITNDNLDGLKQDIQSKIGLYFPNVFVASLDITSDTDNNEVTMVLKYNIIDTGISDQVQITFQ